MESLRIVLHQPEIPQNTGAILRTCAATGAGLHLIGPLGFRLDSAGVRRAGMDYREWVTVQRWHDWEHFLQNLPADALLIAATTKARVRHVDYPFSPASWLLFGSEGSGLPEPILNHCAPHHIRIPMLPQTRSLNLAQSVAIILYEALRQNGFMGMG
ncbi:MAG: tRNA (cytidine(34)-2'-O)-methyltransferase [Magnetococcales bacterium]|nr:tRNA (cytidine(34)-2'-O)-methyltransferase [Magnetococcales bacterium]NGZ04998.1 tRNA (cytidine(34)-2'-O)-methyltransferase [Magnetococcales bacterium]